MLRSIARYGKISNKLGDLQVWDPEFKIPDDIQNELYTKHCHTPATGLRIVRHSDGTLESHDYQNFKTFFLDDNIRLGKDEFLFMKTRIHHGKVSFEDVMYSLSLEMCIFLKTFSIDLVAQKKIWLTCISFQKFKGNFDSY